MDQLRKFWWLTQSAEVEKYISTCHVCQSGKRLTFKASNGMGRTSSGKYPRLKCWSIDVNHMPVGFNGLKYLFCLVDISTGFLEAYPTSKITGKVIALLLRTQIFPRYGRGLVFISDKGPEMLNQFVQTECQDHGSRLYTGTPHHSSSNPVERVNRTINEIMRMKLIDKQMTKDRWPLVLPDVLETIRMTNDETTFSPYYRCFGTRPTTTTQEHFGFDPMEQDMEQTWLTPEFCNGTDPSPWKDPELHLPEENVVKDDNDELITETKIGDKSERKRYKKIIGGHLLEVNNIGTQQMDMTATGTKSKKLVKTKNTLRTAKQGCAQDMAQQLKDNSRAARHYKNKEYTNRGLRYWSPRLGQIVDVTFNSDPLSMSNKKLALFQQGPFKVMAQVHPYAVMVRKLNVDTNQTEGRDYRVMTSSCRPSTSYPMRSRPNHANPLLPPWLL